jgi:hypothetical protein
MKIKTYIYSLLLVGGIYHETLNCQPFYFNKTVDIGGIFGAGLSVLERDSGYIIAGVVGGGRANIGIVLLNSLGDLIELKSFGEAGTDCYAGISSSLKEFNDNYILGGSKDYDTMIVGYILKFNPQGDTIFSREFTSQVSDGFILYNSYPCSDGGFAFTGQCHISGYNADVVLLKTDSSGNEIWRKLYGLGNWDKGFSIFQSPDSGYVIGGYSYQPGVDNTGNPLIVKFDKNGNYQWNRKPGGPLDDKQAMVCTYNDTSFVVLTMYSDSALTYEAEYGRIRVLKYSYSGTVIWDKIFGMSKLDNSVGNIKSLEDGGIVCCGFSIDTSGYYKFGWILRLNSDGDSLWYRDYAFYNHSFGRNYLFDISPTSDNGFIACGETKADPPYNLQKIWILKVDSLGCDTAGCDTTVGIGEQGSLEAWEHGELEIWPNPCREMLNVECSMLNSGRDYELHIYDIFGRTAAANLISLPRLGEGWGGGQAGEGENWTVNVSSLPPGIYLAVIREGTSIVASGKFVVAR